eukprot:TRINITY_DN7662_c0_g2_i1.p1 TRINITY_DN7662_c0_g2~~TRINITY_DN7662_c0_g2_i1.p1  ORF type:complete len:654 (-),score=165.82 TRINITY_DN7662_c0_g2_i1:48-1958(-)
MSGRDAEPEERAALRRRLNGYAPVEELSPSAWLLRRPVQISVGRLKALPSREMVMVMKAKLVAKSRGPSQKIAKAVLKKRQQKEDLKNDAQKIEQQFRKKGGYGKKVVSINDAPVGGIEKSPAYRKLLTRCEVDKNGKPPPPELRDGAPLKGGFPLKKYPPNVVVDGLRCCWLPDDWAQVIKNTGPGGVYHGWMSPEGKFFYHRAGYPSSIEPTLGRKLTVLDGLNGLKRSVRKTVPPGADKAFLQECLTAKERKFVAPASQFHFAVVSARRANYESGMHDIMVIEGHFKQVGVRPMWYVDQDSLEDYKKLGLNAKVGGKLTPSRNMALDDAKKKKLVCVQVSDDISKWLYLDCEKQNFSGEKGFQKQNECLLGTKKHCVSPLAAAQFMLAKMRADPDKPKVAGVFPTGNAAMTLGVEEFGKHHFILGDFFVAEPESPCRFDTNLTLKEDYDYTCSHLKTHGSVLRCNRMFLQVKHSTNAGGAVANRDNNGQKEKMNIAILQEKWPGVFRINKNRKGPAGSEVVMNWKNYGKEKDDRSEKKAKGGSLKKASLKVKKVSLKLKKLSSDFPKDAVVKYTKKTSEVAYLNKRCSRCNGKKVQDCLGMTYTDAGGNERRYGYSDLKYDIAGGRLELSKKR